MVDETETVAPISAAGSSAGAVAVVVSGAGVAVVAGAVAAVVSGVPDVAAGTELEVGCRAAAAVLVELMTF